MEGAGEKKRERNGRWRVTPREDCCWAAVHVLLAPHLLSPCSSVRRADPSGLTAEGIYPGLSVGTDLGDVHAFIHPSIPCRTALPTRYAW